VIYEINRKTASRKRELLARGEGEEAPAARLAPRACDTGSSNGSSRRAAGGRWENERPAHVTTSISRILWQMSCTVTASAGVVYRHSAQITTILALVVGEIPPIPLVASAVSA
jgi:hypothetical protein